MMSQFPQRLPPLISWLVRMGVLAVIFISFSTVPIILDLVGSSKMSALASDTPMISIPGGPFTMGLDGSKPKNGPAHIVDLPAFEIDKYEVTNDEFAQFVEQTGYVTYAEENSNMNWRDAAEGKGNHPVVYITWDDAVAYCTWAHKQLPTEAEWEKAGRSDDGRLYPWGNTFIVENGNFYETGSRETMAVGSFPTGASPYGVEDMAGNVREWVQDYFLPYPGQSDNADPFFGEDLRVNRGGGWFDGGRGEAVTTYHRLAAPPGATAHDDIGFRCVRDNRLIFLPLIQKTGRDAKL